MSGSPPPVAPQGTLEPSSASPATEAAASREVAREVEDPAARSRVARGPSPLTRWAVTLVLLGGLCWCTDTASLVRTLSAARPGYLAAAGVLLLTACLVSAGVWLYVVRLLGCTVSFGQAALLNLVGFFFNSVIPSGLGGDVWRAWVFAGFPAVGCSEAAEPAVGSSPPSVVAKDAALRHQVGVARAFASVFVERWVAFAALVLVSLGCVPLAAPRLHGMRLRVAAAWQVDLGWLVVIFALLMAAVLAVSLLVLLPSRGAQGLSGPDGSGREERSELASTFVTSALPPMWREHAAGFMGALGQLTSQRSGLAVAVALNLLSPAVESVAYWCLAEALDLHPGVAAFVVFTPVLRILHHIPIAMDAAGVQDAALMVAASAFGWSVEQGLSLSLLMHAARLLVSLVGLPCYLAMQLRPGLLGTGVGLDLAEHGGGEVLGQASR